MKKVHLKNTKHNSFNFTKKLIVFTFLATFMFSCSNDDDGKPPMVITKISQDIKSLIYFKGNEKAPTVLINAQGGPAPALNTDTVEFIVNTFDTTDILTVNVHQAQTLTPSILMNGDITLHQAVNYNNESIEMLSKVISYFKSQGRTVYVLGLSFGAFVVQDLIAKKGIDSADKYLIITGRLDMNTEMWQALAEGKDGYFENGTTPVLDPEPHEVVEERNLSRFSAALAKHRYTQLFEPIQDLSNLTYIYGKTDMAVGRLTTEEVQFLESKNATILTGNGGHDEPFEDFCEQGFSQAFGIEPKQ